MTIFEKEVNFYKYCRICEHRTKAEHEEPCHTCLAEPAVENSKKPIKFVTKDLCIK